MSITNVAAGSPAALQGAGNRFYLAGAGEFADKLTVGQVLKGRVLRQYDQSRYLVGFEGNERVVDSGVPLRTGELIHGRVMAVGERVELQRIYAQDATDLAGAAMPVPGESLPEGVGTRSDQLLEQLIGRYQATLSPADRAQLGKAVRSAADGANMGLAGIMLSKLGLPQSSELLGALYTNLTRRPAATSAAEVVAQLEAAAPGAVAAPTQAIQQLGEMLKTAIEDRTRAHDSREQAASGTPQMSLPVAGAAPEAVRQVRADGDERNQRGIRDLGRWLLNAQTGGSVAHRHETLPLLLGDQLVEVDLALFSQQRDGEQKPAARHRQLVFSLNTESLGRVEISARLVGERLRVQVATEDSDTTAFMAEHATALREALQQLGWTLDEVVYETRPAPVAGSATQAVVEHVIRQDSLNRLV